MSSKVFEKEPNFWVDEKGNEISGVDPELEKLVGTFYYFKVIDQRDGSENWLEGTNELGQADRLCRTDLEDAKLEAVFIQDTLPNWLKVELIAEETVAINKTKEDVDNIDFKDKEQSDNFLRETITSLEEQ